MVNRLFEFDKILPQEIKRIIVFGDIHGDLDPFSRYVESLNLQENFLVFLGDYADRGLYGVECIDFVDRLLTLYPDKVIGLQGNHEDYSPDGIPAFNPCDLIQEVHKKRRSWQKYYETTFLPFKNKLYLSALIPGYYLMVHGGISSKIVSKTSLKNPSPELVKDLMWSDPYESHVEGKEEFLSHRGLGTLFGNNVTDRTCRLLGIERIIRSHQPQVARKGIHYNHEGRIITINSTSVYQGAPFVLIIDPSNDYGISTKFI